MARRHHGCRQCDAHVPVLDVSACSYQVVKDVAGVFGWELLEDNDDSATEFGKSLKNGFDLRWTDLSVAAERVMHMKEGQVTNHFPGMAAICRKGDLARNLAAMIAESPLDFPFVPPTWVLPTDGGSLEATMDAAPAGTIFIAKPVRGSMGRGIKLVRTWPQVTRAVAAAAKEVGAQGCKEVVVQQYIPNPLLIENRKFDLRLYVLVTSAEPLEASMFCEGLVRLCGEEYEAPSEQNMERKRVHLTNYSVNKGLVEETGADPIQGGGLKRSLSWFKVWFEKENGGDWQALWSQLRDCALKTLIAAAPTIAHNYSAANPKVTKRFGQPQHHHHRKSTTGYTAAGPTKGGGGSGGSKCFEILGFDMMIDSKSHVWLIEVNHSPSFGCDSPLDARVKKGLIAAVFRRQLRTWGHACGHWRNNLIDDVNGDGGFEPLLPSTDPEENDLVQELLAVSRRNFKQRLFAPRLPLRLRAAVTRMATMELLPDTTAVAPAPAVVPGTSGPELGEATEGQAPSETPAGEPETPEGQAEPHNNGTGAQARTPPTVAEARAFRQRKVLRAVVQAWHQSVLEEARQARLRQFLEKEKRRRQTERRLVVQQHWNRQGRQQSMEPASEPSTEPTDEATGGQAEVQSSRRPRGRVEALGSPTEDKERRSQRAVEVGRAYPLPSEQHLLGSQSHHRSRRSQSHVSTRSKASKPLLAATTRAKAWNRSFHGQASQVSREKEHERGRSEASRGPKSNSQSRSGSKNSRNMAGNFSSGKRYMMPSSLQRYNQSANHCNSVKEIRHHLKQTTRSTSTPPMAASSLSLTKMLLMDIGDQCGVGN